jgi:hypothetical protein
MGYNNNSRCLLNRSVPNTRLESIGLHTCFRIE